MQRHAFAVDCFDHAGAQATAHSTPPATSSVGFYPFLVFRAGKKVFPFSSERVGLIARAGALCRARSRTSFASSSSRGAKAQAPARLTKSISASIASTSIREAAATSVGGVSSSRAVAAVWRTVSRSPAWPDMLLPARLRTDGRGYPPVSTRRE